MRVFLLLTVLHVALAQVAYVNMPSQIWNKQYHTVGGNRRMTLNGVCQDLVGNIFTVGYTWKDFEFHSVIGDQAAFVMKFAPDGTRIWIRFLDSYRNEEANACRTDASGGVAVVGRTSGTLSTFGESPGSETNEAFLATFDASGSLQWVRQFREPDSYYWEDQSAYDVAFDAESNIYLASRAYANGRTQLFVTKFYTNGTTAWKQNVGSTTDHSYIGSASSPSSRNGAGNGALYYGEYESEDYGKILDCTAFGDCYVAFTTSGGMNPTIGTASGNQDAYIVKLDTAGTVQWTLVHGSPNDEQVYALRLDAFGNVWLAGATNGGLAGERTFGQMDAFVSKFSSAGQHLFTRIFGSNQQQRVLSLAGDGQGAMYMTVEQTNTQSSTPNADFFDGTTYPFYYHRLGYVVKMDSFGNRLFTNLLGPGMPNNNMNYYVHVIPQDITVNADGSQLVVVGKYSGLFNDASLAFPSYPNIPGGFIFAAAPPQTCNATSFDSVMGEINDLLYTLGV